MQACSREVERLTAMVATLEADTEGLTQAAMHSLRFTEAVSTKQQAVV